MNLFKNDERLLIKKYMNINLLNNKNKLIEFIKNFIQIKNCEINKYGEVLTPLWLINDILNKLEEIDKNIFKKKYKWFDPCCGIGLFHIMIYFRLIKYHSKKDIINKMFYANEINKKNVFLYKLIFGENSNINCGDSLLIDNNIKYDIIIGNPPYNSGTKNTGHTIYQDFIDKFLNQYNKYISFINPPGWRKPEKDNNKLFNKMVKENHLCYLEIHNSNDGIKTFNAGTRYDWFIINKDINNKISYIKDIDKKIYKINCNKFDFLPHGNIINIQKILCKYKNNSINANKCYEHSSNNIRKKNSNISRIKSKEFKYPVIHSTTRNEIKYLYTNDNTIGSFGIKKIIFGDSYINPIDDFKGEYGTSEHAIYITYDNEIEHKNYLKYLKDNKFKELISKYLIFSNYQINYQIFNYIKKDFYLSFV